MRKVFLCIASLLTASATGAQPQVLNLDSCYRLAKDNYPLIQKQQLIRQSSSYTLNNAARAYLPQLSFGGQASYQSQTINFAEVMPPIPGVSFPQLSKDQYKIQADISQQVYDGGAVHQQRNYLRASQSVQEQQVEVSLYAIRERVNQMYFSILLVTEQLTQNDLRKADLQQAADKMQAALDNGTAFRSNLDQLKAELVNAEMAGIELQATRTAYIQMLGIWLHTQLDSNTTFLRPEAPAVTDEVHRPEIRLFDLQQQLYDREAQKLRSDYTPKLSAFFQGAYGRPTLNFVDNSFGPWYVTGLRLNWNLGSLYTLRNNKSVIRNNQQLVAADREVFLFNTRLSMTQQQVMLQKYEQLIGEDNKAIVLRTAVKQSAQAQLDNGVITVYDFIAQLNAENMAKQSLILHQIQKLATAYDLNYASGN